MSLLLKIYFTTVVLIIPYLFFRRERNFVFNRFYLLFVIVFSPVFPLIEGLFLKGNVSAAQVYYLDPVNVFWEGKVMMSYQLFSEVVGWVYLAVSVLLLLWLFYKIERVLLFAARGNKTKWNTVFVVLHPKIKTDFSFFSFVFVRDSLPSENMILEHEIIHVKQYHSVDVLLSELFLALNWLNPFAWWLRREILINHEYIVDAELLKSFDKVAYKEMLLTRAFHLPGNVIGSTFSYVKLKNRFIMMNQHEQVKRKWKLFAVLPIITVLTMGFGYATSATINFESHSAVDEGQEPEKNPDVMPEYPGGTEAMSAFIGKELKYPESARKEGKSGKVMVGFIVDKRGSVVNVKLVRGFDVACDEEALRVVKMMPKWTPGKKEGKVVDVEMILPIVFQLP